ncbi:hypothetical protein GCM10022207_89400 [Streptomyces lannensis]|uniref:Uncharacterized protein n=1 Tax=Streptomyces lannensis TaxID=766498 RepID=A0ABP7LPI4_9ACTN
MLTPQRHREVDKVGSPGRGLDVDNGDLVDEVGPHGGTASVEEVHPGVPRHGATTADVVKALQQAPLRETTREVHSARSLLLRQWREQPIGLMSEAPEVSVVLIGGQSALLPLPATD